MSTGIFSCTETVILPNLKASIARATDAQQRKLLDQIMKECNEAGERLVTCHDNHPDIGGRMYAPKGTSLAFVSKEVRKIISVPCWDFDLANAHPCILAALCNHYNIPCPSLLDYINRREQWLEDTPVGLTGDDVKLACLRVMYGSGERPLTTRIAGLQSEMAAILAAMAPRYAELAQALKKHKPRLKDAKMGATLMSFILQREEVRLIMTTIRVLSREYPTAKINAYIFDGFLIRRDNNLSPTVLLECMNRVLDNDALVGGRMHFIQKPFEVPDDFLPLQPGEGNPTTDVDALLYVVRAFPDYIKMNGDKKAIYDDTKGLWALDSNAWGPFLRLVHKSFALNNPYGSSKRLIQSMFDCMPILEDETAFFIKGRHGIEGKLLFQDCIYDKSGECRMPFTHELFFVHQVPWPCPTEEPPLTDEVKKWFFYDSFPEGGKPAYVMQTLMRAAFGLGYHDLAFETGPGSNGKSVRAQAVRNALGPYVADLDGTHVAIEEHAQPGSASPQAMVFEHARIVYITEPPRKMVLNMPMLKRLTGGDPITARGLYKGLTSFTSSSKVWFLVNNIPNFSECEESYMNKRLRQIDSPVRWLGPVEYEKFKSTSMKSDEEAAAELVLRADEDLSRKCQSASDALLWLLINEPIRDLATVTPECVIAASRETVAERDEVRRIFDDNYEWTRDDSDRVASSDFTFRMRDHIKDGKELAKHMKKWGFGGPTQMRIDGRVTQGYAGVRKRARDWEY